jgi:hypothetical protein
MEVFEAFFNALNRPLREKVRISYPRDGVAFVYSEDSLEVIKITVEPTDFQSLGEARVHYERNRNAKQHPSGTPARP